MTNLTWLASYPAAPAWDMPLKPQPLDQLLAASATRHPDAPCLEFFGSRFSYQEVDGMTTRLAGHLQARGIGPGVHVGLLMPNCPAFVVSAMAIWRSGATLVPLNPLSGPRELQGFAERAGIRWCLAADLALCQTALEPLLPRLEGVILARFAAQMPRLKGMAMRLLKPGMFGPAPQHRNLLDWHGLIAKPSVFSPPEIDPMTHLASLQPTGGTTGLPKAAMLTHANLSVNALQSLAWVGGLGADHHRILAVLPLFHGFAMTTVLLLGLAAGAELLLKPRFDAEDTLRAIHRQRPSLMCGVPSLFAALAAHPRVGRYDLSSLRWCISGGAPLPAAVAERFMAMTGCMLVEGYGLTEASPVCAANPLTGGVIRPNTIGLPFPQTVLEIRNPEPPYALMPPGEIGELCVRGPQVMQGYWQSPAETQQVLVPDAAGVFLRTGDLASMDSEGYVTIAGRAKELIITNGYNVYPRQVEEALHRHPAIAEAAVLGVDDPKHGQKVVAYVAFHPGQQADDAALRAHLMPLIARYALPQAYHFRDQLPKTLIGKVDKKALMSYLPNES